MFCLHVSNRGENLLAHLAAVFQADEKRDILRPELFLVQSRGAEMMIRQFLADKFVSWGNYRFLYPLPFIDYLAKCLAMPTDAAMFEHDRLAWRLESLLRRLQTPAIAAFLAQEPITLKRYQLARQLAGLFERYQLMRPEMLAAWQTGRTATKNAHEEWQAELWRRLRGEMPETERAAERGELLRQLTERLREPQQSPGQPELASLPQRVSVFGLHTMPPALLHCLNALSARLDVHLYLLSPCRHYWLDARRAAPWRDGAVDETYHPLLVALGQEGREFQTLLEEMVSPDLRPTSYHFPVEGDEPTLLRQLQADILDGLRPAAGSRHFAADDSLRVAACFSRRREVEVLKDHILDFLEKNPDLHLRDLVVMAPDISPYLPFIAAIFHDIPHSVAGRGLGRLNRTLAIVLDFLRLLRGRCGWAAVLDLLGREPLAAHWQLTPADFASLRQWIPASGIRWGLDREHLAALSLPDDLAITWEAGLARMTLGFALGDGQPWQDIVPWDGVEGGDGHLLGRLHGFIGLMRKKLHQFAVDCPLGRWSGRLVSLLAELFPGLDEDGGDACEELGELRQILAGLAAIPENEHREPVSLAVIIDWLSRQAETPTAGDFSRGRLTFCPMPPMRSIPFAGIFLLGLNDGDFPRRDAEASFDLLRATWRLGDRNLQADDRYQFLEAILSARRTLYLSYVGKSAKKGDELPPSVVVGELLTTLAEDYGVRDIVVEHPLHPFDRRYFTGNGPLFSYAEELTPKNDAPDALLVAKKPWWRGELAFAPQTVSLADWLEFAAHPQRYFFRRRLGLDWREATSVTPESENFTVDPLEKWQAQHEIFAAIAAGKSEAEMAAKLAASGAWPLGGPGQALFQEQWQKMTGFVTTIAGLDLGEPLPRRFFAVDCGAFLCQGMLAACHERGLLLIKHRRLKGRDLLQGWLLALLLRHIPDAPQDVILACADDVSWLRADDEAAPSLADMAGLFVQGNRAPSALLIEPAFAWAKQELSTSPRKTAPDDKAEQELQKTLAENRETAWEKLFAHREAPLWQPEHREAAKTFMLPLIARLRTRL